MHYHVPKPFYRKSRKTWYVQISGRQVNLGQDRTDAFRRHYEIMANPPEKRLDSVDHGEGMKLCQLFDFFLEWLQHNRSFATYGWYQYRLQRFADFYPDLTVSQLKPFHVQQWVDQYQEHATTTSRNYMRSVKSCLKWATRQGYIEKDPIAGLEVPAGEARDVFIPRDEFNQILAATSESNLRDLMIVTYETGCRPQESLRLEIRHVDLNAQRWVLPRSEAKGKKAPRAVYLTPVAAEIVKPLIAGRTNGFVFRNSNGKKWTVSAVNCAFTRIRDRFGIAAMDEQKIQIPESEIEAQIKKLRLVRMQAGKEVPKTKAEIRCEAKRKVRKRMAHQYAPKYSLFVAGWAHLRAGNVEKALQRLVQSNDAEWFGKGIAYPLIAIANHRLGRADEAVKAIEQSQALFDRLLNESVSRQSGAPMIPWIDWIEFLLNFREASIVVKGHTPADDPRFRQMQLAAETAISP